jgi:hypothetical protein
MVVPLEKVSYLIVRSCMAIETNDRRLITIGLQWGTLFPVTPAPWFNTSPRHTILYIQCLPQPLPNRAVTLNETTEVKSVTGCRHDTGNYFPYISGLAAKVKILYNTLRIWHK